MRKFMDQIMEQKIMEQIEQKEIALDSNMRTFDKALEFVASEEFREKVLSLTKVVVDLTKESLISSGSSPTDADELVGSLVKLEIIDLIIRIIKRFLFPEDTTTKEPVLNEK